MPRAIGLSARHRREIVKSTALALAKKPALAVKADQHEPPVERKFEALFEGGEQLLAELTSFNEQPAMRAYAPARPLPGTDEAARRHLALPMSAVLTRAQCVEVTGAVRAAQRGGREKPATVRSS